MERIAQIATSTPGVSRVTLMPYHTLGKSKYETLGLTPGYETDKVINRTRLDEFKTLFAARGLAVE
jgi:pyruvate-formate lyase-activating enzyme